MFAPRALVWSSTMVLFGLLLLGAPGALAAPQKEDQATTQARELYRNATKHYQLGEYREALAAYKEAYRLKEDASFLFNIGQCHRLLGAHEDAAHAYRAYLRARPDAPNRVDVEGFIATEDKSVEDERARVAAAEELRRKEADVKLAAAGRGGPWYSDTVGWVLVAGGFALTAGGAAVVAYGSTLKPSAAGVGPALSTELRNRQTISWAAGGVALGAGIGMLTGGIVRFVARSRRQAATVAILPGLVPEAGGASLLLGGAW